MLSLSYHNCSAVGGRRVNMILHALPNQGGGGRTLSVAAYYG